ncbi:MAG: type II secretion system F family protein [Tepidisphaeraceae bacterium]
MTEQIPKGSTFAYKAITSDGQRISGSIDARDEAEALRRLQSLQMAQIELAPGGPLPRPKPLRGEDFLAFNQQLAQLTGAGLPVEQGLRMIAAEMRRGSMHRTLDLVAAELESGKTLPEAVAAYRDKFPPLYAQLIDAGIRAGNLSGILLNLGRHLTLVRKLQAALWQALSYPAIVMVAFFGVLYFMLVALVPKWEPMLLGFANVRFWVRTNGAYSPRDLAIPWLTRALFDVSNIVSSWPQLLVLAVVAILAAGAWAFLRMTSRNEAFSERLLLPVPLIGSVLRQNLISRWCHAVALAVEAGLDLPAAITLADDATASPRLSADGAAMIAAVNSGLPLSLARVRQILPATVVAAMEMSAARGDLPLTLRAMAQMYQDQAELRLGTLQAILTPILLILIGLAVGGLMLAMFLPLLNILNMI